MQNYKDYYQYLIDTISIDEICFKLGMNVIGKGHSKKCLCPFHEDTHPSMNIYEKQYHCFACNEHGNIFSLIKKKNDCDFLSCINWIEKEFPFVLERKPKREKKENVKTNGMQDDIDGYEIALNCYKDMTLAENRELITFSEERRFFHDFMKYVEIYFSNGGKLTRKHDDKAKQFKELKEKELIVVDSNEARDFYYKNRVIITLRNLQNQIVGFAGRACNNDTPKYLFTKKLPKGNFLYRLNIVKDKIIQSKQDVEHIFLVEGIFDALRLEMLGFNGVAVLGSHVTQEQVKVLEELIGIINKKIILHIYMDSDSAGIKGTYQSIRNLWLNAKMRHVQVDTIINKEYLIMSLQNKNNEKKNNDVNIVVQGKDPDDALLNMDPDDVKLFLKDNNMGIFEFLLRYESNHESLVIDRELKEYYVSEKSIEQRIVLLENSTNIISREELKNILQRYEYIEKGEKTKDNEFAIAVLRSYTSGENQKNFIDEKYICANDFSAVMQNAVFIAKSSYSKQEAILDDSTWNRILICADVFYPYFRNQIKNSWHQKTPRIAFYLPKNINEYRTKTLFCHEDLIMQQYMLNELLRQDSDITFERCIPAVRYQENKVNEMYTTGEGYFDFYQNNENKVVSFAYQINMSVINGENISETGMFRPFYDCWKSFIQFIQEGIQLLDNDKVYLVRLDVKKFYDNITDYSLRGALTPFIEEALKNTDRRFDIIEIDNPKEKANKIVQWFIEEAFNGSYYNPDGSGIVNDKFNLGIPQGPNLSSYIANIVLFEMDRVIEEFVYEQNNSYKLRDKENIGITVRYARYVDDMVIISNDPILIDRITIMISSELYKLGLSLSSKTDAAEAISKEKALEWTIDKRGGLGVSASFDFEDETIEEIIDNYAEVSSIDRRNGLTLLRNMNLGFEYITESFTFDKLPERLIDTFFKTDDVRYNDLVWFSKMLICYFLKVEINSDKIWNKFNDLLKRGAEYSPRNSLFQIEGISLLLFIEGIRGILLKSSTDVFSKLVKNEENYKKIFECLDKHNFISEYEKITENSHCVIPELLDTGKLV